MASNDPHPGHDEVWGRSRSERRFALSRLMVALLWNGLVMWLLARHRHGLMRRALQAALDMAASLPALLFMGGSTGGLATHPGVAAGWHTGIQRGAIHVLARIQLPLLLLFPGACAWITLHPWAIQLLFHAHLGLFHILMPLHAGMCRGRGA